MSVRRTQNLITHITQPGTAGTGAAHNGDDIAAATTDVRGTVKLAAAAKTGKLEDLKTAVGNTASTCKGCHDTFRAK